MKNWPKRCRKFGRNAGIACSAFAGAFAAAGCLVGEVMPELNRNGFQIEPFGGRSVLIRSAPAIAGDLDCRKLLSEILEGMETEERTLDVDRIQGQDCRRHGMPRRNQSKYAACPRKRCSGCWMSWRTRAFRPTAPMAGPSCFALPRMKSREISDASRQRCGNAQAKLYLCFLKTGCAYCLNQITEGSIVARPI